MIDDLFIYEFILVILEIGFEENIDFTVTLKNERNSQDGRSSKEYHVSTEMGKELAMLERNEKGREARKYFIQGNFCNNPLIKEIRT